MEVLNNIWNALWTENITLVTVSSTPLIFLELYLSFCLFSNLLNINYTIKQKLLYVILCSIWSIMTSIFIPSPFNVICSYLVFFMIIYFTFKLKFIKTLIALFLPTIIFALVNLLIV